MTRASLILELCSLFLLTPTIIGEDKMEGARIRTNNGVKKAKDWMGHIRTLVIRGAIIAACFLGLFALASIYNASQAATPLIPDGYGKQSSQFVSFIVRWTLIIGGSLIAVCVALVVIVGVIYGVMLVVNFFVGYGTKSAHALLVTGAILFTISIFLAFIVTLLPTSQAASTPG
jgi:hypothetical protein